MSSGCSESSTSMASHPHTRGTYMGPPHLYPPGPYMLASSPYSYPASSLLYPASGFERRLPLPAHPPIAGISSFSPSTLPTPFTSTTASASDSNSHSISIDPTPSVIPTPSPPGHFFSSLPYLHGIPPFPPHGPLLPLLHHLVPFCPPPIDYDASSSSVRLLPPPPLSTYPSSSSTSEKGARMDTCPVTTIPESCISITMKSGSSAPSPSSPIDDENTSSDREDAFDSNEKKVELKPIGRSRVPNMSSSSSTVTRSKRDVVEDEEKSELLHPPIPRERTKRQIQKLRVRQEPVQVEALIDENKQLRALLHELQKQYHLPIPLLPLKSPTPVFLIHATTLAIYLTKEEDRKERNKKKVKEDKKWAPLGDEDDIHDAATLVPSFTAVSAEAASALTQLASGVCGLGGAGGVGRADGVGRAVSTHAKGRGATFTKEDEAEIMICVYRGKNGRLYFGGPDIALALHLNKQNRAKMNEVLKAADVPAHPDNFGKMFVRKPRLPLDVHIEPGSYTLTFGKAQKFTPPQTTWGVAFRAAHQLISKRKSSGEPHIRAAAVTLEQRLLEFPPYYKWQTTTVSTGTKRTRGKREEEPSEGEEEGDDGNEGGPVYKPSYKSARTISDSHSTSCHTPACVSRNGSTGMSTPTLAVNQEEHKEGSFTWSSHSLNT